MLSKFQNLYEIDLDGGATDGQLEALAGNGFSNLTEAVLTVFPTISPREDVSAFRYRDGME